jgi:Mg-chelatase subunit ChlD
MRAWNRILAVAALFTALSLPVLADTRTANIDVIIALDKSLSMEKKVGAVEQYVNSVIIDGKLIPNDQLVVIAFYGKADVLISQTVKDEADKTALKKTILKVQGNGSYTDIGNAVDKVKEIADKMDSDEQSASQDGTKRLKYILLLTDGIQEPPPSSKYYRKDVFTDHEFLTNAATIQQAGWKVMTLGLGSDTLARELAKQLQGSFAEISANPTADELSNAASTLFGTASIEGKVTVDPIGAGGDSRVRFVLKSSGLQGDTQIVVSDLTAQVGARTVTGLLASPVTVTVKQNQTAAVDIPVRFLPALPAGAVDATLEFAFSSQDRFAPSSVGVTLVVRGWFLNNLLLVIGLALVLIGIAFAAFLLIRRLTRGRPVRFSVSVDGETIGKGTLSLPAGRALYLNELSGNFSLPDKRTGRSIARFSSRKGALVLEILKQDRFPKVKELPPDARGKTFPLRSEDGQNLLLKVHSGERKK